MGRPLFLCPEWDNIVGFLGSQKRDVAALYPRLRYQNGRPTHPTCHEYGFVRPTDNGDDVQRVRIISPNGLTPVQLRLPVHAGGASTSG